VTSSAFLFRGKGRFFCSDRYGGGNRFRSGKGPGDLAGGEGAGSPLRIKPCVLQEGGFPALHRPYVLIRAVLM
jgi:hypothetical protein